MLRQLLVRMLRTHSDVTTREHHRGFLPAVYDDGSVTTLPCHVYSFFFQPPIPSPCGGDQEAMFRVMMVAATQTKHIENHYNFQRVRFHRRAHTHPPECTDPPARKMCVTSFAVAATPSQFSVSRAKAFKSTWSHGGGDGGGGVGGGSGGDKGGARGEGGRGSIDSFVNRWYTVYDWLPHVLVRE